MTDCVGGACGHCRTSRLDFGSANLVNGAATVQIDPGFANIVLTDMYHVFLTPLGDSKGLYVSNRSSTSFEVREQQDGRSSLSFSYRTVAKRADVAAARLQRIEVPTPRKSPGKVAAPQTEVPLPPHKDVPVPVPVALAPAKPAQPEIQLPKPRR
jgi:hypothetical protein